MRAYRGPLMTTGITHRAIRDISKHLLQLIALVVITSNIDM